MGTSNYFKGLSSLCIILGAGILITSGILLDAGIQFLNELYWISIHDQEYLDGRFYEIAYRLIGVSIAGIVSGLTQIVVSIVLILDPGKYLKIWAGIHGLIWAICVVIFGIAIATATGDKVKAFCGLTGANFVFILLVFLYAIYAVKFGRGIFILK